MVRNRSGNALFRIRYHGRSIFVVLPKKDMSEVKLGRIKTALAAVLQDETHLQVSGAAMDFPKLRHSDRVVPRALLTAADAQTEAMNGSHFGQAPGS